MQIKKFNNLAKSELKERSVHRIFREFKEKNYYSATREVWQHQPFSTTGRRKNFTSLKKLYFLKFLKLLGKDDAIYHKRPAWQGVSAQCECSKNFMFI
jgi:hypothetical protein